MFKYIGMISLTSFSLKVGEQFLSLLSFPLQLNWEGTSLHNDVGLGVGLGEEGVLTLVILDKEVKIQNREASISMLELYRSLHLDHWLSLKKI